MLVVVVEVVVVVDAGTPSWKMLIDWTFQKTSLKASGVEAT